MLFYEGGILRIQAIGMMVSAMVATAVAMGCGSSSDGQSGTEAHSGRTVAAVPSPSRAEFVEQANATCAKARAGLAGRVSRFERLRNGRKTEPGADMVHFVYLPAMETQIWRIEELGVPPGEEEQIDAMLDAERFGVDANAVKALVPSIAAAEREFAEADKLFRAYGLHACVTDGGKKKGPG